MNRHELLMELNELIESENGNHIDEYTKIVDSGIDSFGITMVFIEIEKKYNIYSKEEFKTIPFDTITPKEVIDRILDKNNDSK